MMWYEIPGVPRYRMNHLGEIMSLQGETPIILDYKDKVRLWVGGRYLTYDTHALMDLVLAGKPLQGCTHHEAARVECDHGHEFTPENTMWRNAKGRRYRMCRSCFNKRMRQYRAKRKAASGGVRSSPADGLQSSSPATE